jgi:amidase
MALVLMLVGPALLGADARQIFAQGFYGTFSHANPVLEHIKSGEIISTRTIDCDGMDENSELRSRLVNPLTGPFYVDGAEPGDVLVVHLRKLRMNRNWGHSAFRLLLNAVTPEYVEKIYPEKYKPDAALQGRDELVRWDIDLAHSTVHLREPVSQHARLEFPTRPMLGCVGVAAQGNFIPTSLTSASYGGNLDYNQIAEGAAVMFPVYHPGALLYMGDGHALMADGEAIGTGIETSMDVEFSVEVRKKANLTGPRVETTDDLISVGAQPEFESSLDRALQLATTDMVRWLVSEYRLEPWAAHLMIGTVGKYDVVTVQGTMALRIPKRYLPERQ